MIAHQHVFKHKHSTYTTLHNICHQIIKSFNNPRLPQCTVAVALNVSKAFDTVNIHKLIHKLTLTNIPNIIITFIANYIKGQQAYTQYNGTLSKLKTNQHLSHKVEFYLQRYSTFTLLTFHFPQKTYKSQHMLMMT